MNINNMDMYYFVHELLSFRGKNFSVPQTPLPLSLVDRLCESKATELQGHIFSSTSTDSVIIVDAPMNMSTSVSGSSSNHDIVVDPPMNHSYKMVDSIDEGRSAMNMSTSVSGSSSNRDIIVDLNMNYDKKVIVLKDHFLL